MATYILSYLQHTNIRQGGHAMYSTAKQMTVKIIATDDTEARTKAKKKWEQILYDAKQPDSAVIFVDLTRKVNWSPGKKRVQFDSKMKLVA